MDPGGGVLKFGRFELDLVRRELRRDGVPVELQRTPLRLLLYLAEHRDRAVPRQELLDELWRGAAVTDSSVASALNQIRSAVEDDGSSQRVIRTLRGRGLRFVAVAPELETASPTWRRRTPWLTGIALLVLVAGFAAWWLGRPTAPPPIRSLAVLPFANLSGDPEQEYVADAMTEALTGELAKIGSLRVISRTSVMQYRGTHKTTPQIAGELNVEGLIEGSVVREGTRIRIYLQLLDGRTDTHLWSQSYERELGSVLSLYGEVVREVAVQIRVGLTPDERSRLSSSRTVTSEAYDAYMRGLQFLGASDLTGILAWGPDAIEHLERAVHLDPGFAEAWVALGDLYRQLSLRDFSDRDLERKVREAVQRALELDDSLGRAHTLLAGILRFYDWDFVGARKAHERAIELSPNDLFVIANYAVFLAEVEGRTQEAIDLTARLPILGRFFPASRIAYAKAFVDDGQYERALEEYERVRELVPGWQGELEFFSYMQLGRFDEAYAVLKSLLERQGLRAEERRKAFERGWADRGWPGAMRAFADAAAQRPDFSPARVAMACAWIGDFDEAFAWLERAYRARDPMITGLKSVYFSQLRSDPRYDGLVRRIGLPGS